MTPSLVSWAGQLSPEGEQLSAWLNLIGAPIPEVTDGSLLKPAALYFRRMSDGEQARLWQQYISSAEKERDY